MKKPPHIVPRTPRPASSTAQSNFTAEGAPPPGQVGASPTGAPVGKSASQRSPAAQARAKESAR
jgi:hypothetical protein